ncbi:MAG: MMPL family transporter, partial [Gemmatimonadetes bacterium]|nr:MMPL family transporter [Gemmatimonadota bacterium]
KAFTVADVEDRAALNILHTTRPGSLTGLRDAVASARDYEQPPGDVRATPSGLAVVGVGLLENIEDGRATITYLALGLAFVFLTLRLRSIFRGVMCLVPLLIATGTSSLVAYLLDFKLSPMTAVGGPIVIAACAEFTTLILLRFVEERRRGLTPQAASDVAAARTGSAFVLSALTTVVGIGVIATSSLPILRDFGLVVAMNVIVALLSALVILPPILVWADGKRWVTRGLVPSDVLDRATRTEDEPEPETADIGHAGPRPLPED